MFTLEDIQKAIYMARLIQDNKDIFEIESLLGLTEVCTHSMDMVYSEDQIINFLTKSNENNSNFRGCEM